MDIAGIMACRGLQCVCMVEKMSKDIGIIIHKRTCFCYFFGGESMDGCGCTATDHVSALAWLHIL